MRINEELVLQLLDIFIEEEVKKVGFNSVVVPVSGGIDSALVAHLAKRVFPDNTHLIYIFDEEFNSEESLNYVKDLASDLKLELKIINLTPIRKQFSDDIKDKRRIANFVARVRMAYVFDYSFEKKALVLGGSNKTELLLGYATWYGDMAAALWPIGDLYKTQVYQLSRYLNVDERIINRAPTAELWEGQTDEKELGASYELIDKILFDWVDNRKPVSVLYENYDRAIVDKIINMVKNAEFKRHLPLIPKISARTIGFEFRFPRDWGR